MTRSAQPSWSRRPTPASDGYTHRFFTTPHSVEDLVADQKAIAEWARMTYGWMGRSPDYKASFLGTLGANAEFYQPFEANARRWYRESQEKVLFWNHAIVHPPVDRNRPPDEVGDVFVHVERETDGGLIVSGAKVVATGSALAHYNFIAHYGLPVRKRQFALVATIADGRARGEADLPAVVFGHVRGDGQPVRLPAVLANGRERHHSGPG